MLEFMISQFTELAKLDQALAQLRIRYLRAALAGTRTGANSPESDAETERITAAIRDHYRGEKWKSRFPPDPEEPDPLVKTTLWSNRDLARKIVVLLHRMIMATPVVGCLADDVGQGRSHETA
jgi:hypothetical protein